MATRNSPAIKRPQAPRPKSTKPKNINTAAGRRPRQPTRGADGRFKKA